MKKRELNISIKSKRQKVMMMIMISCTKYTVDTLHAYKISKENMI